MDNKKKRILHISKYYYPFSGGIEQTARDCVLALKNEYEQKVIAFQDGKKDSKEQIDGVDVYRCGCLAKISAQSLSVSYLWILRNVIEEFEPDCIIFHYPNPFVTTILLNILKKYQTKLVIYWHLDITRQKILKAFFHEQNKKLLARADKIIATSPNYIEGSKWLLSAKDKCVVISSCMNEKRMEITQKVQERAKIIREENKDKIICLAIGRHTKYKGFEYLIEAFKQLEDNYQLFLVGTGELTKQLHRLAHGDEKIIFTGKIEDDELKALLLACDIFCFPSITKNEAFGLVLTEAMYYEKPTVTFTIKGSGVNYVSMNQITGIEVENGNVEQYANAIKRLAMDKELREQYGKAGKQRVEEKFLFAKFSEGIRRIIGDL